MKVNIYRRNQWFEANFSTFNMHFIIICFTSLSPDVSLSIIKNIVLVGWCHGSTFICISVDQSFILIISQILLQLKRYWIYEDEGIKVSYKAHLEFLILYTDAYETPMLFVICTILSRFPRQLYALRSTQRLKYLTFF